MLEEGTEGGDSGRNSGPGRALDGEAEVVRGQGSGPMKLWETDRGLGGWASCMPSFSETEVEVLLFELRAAVTRRRSVCSWRWPWGKQGPCA